MKLEELKKINQEPSEQDKITQAKKYLENLISSSNKIESELETILNYIEALEDRNEHIVIRFNDEIQRLLGYISHVEGDAAFLLDTPIDRTKYVSHLKSMIDGIKKCIKIIEGGEYY